MYQIDLLSLGPGLGLVEGAVPRTPSEARSAGRKGQGLLKGPGGISSCHLLRDLCGGVSLKLDLRRCQPGRPVYSGAKGLISQGLSFVIWSWGSKMPQECHANEI